MNETFKSIKLLIETQEEIEANEEDGLLPEHIMARTIINLCQKILLQGLK